MRLMSVPSRRREARRRLCTAQDVYDSCMSDLLCAACLRVGKPDVVAVTVSAGFALCGLHAKESVVIGLEQR